jgi:hypothetical protein
LEGRKARAGSWLYDGGQVLSYRLLDSCCASIINVRITLHCMFPWEGKHDIQAAKDILAAIICSIVAWQMVRHDFPASQDTLFILMESYQRFVVNEPRAT